MKKLNYFYIEMIISIILAIIIFRISFWGVDLINEANNMNEYLSFPKKPYEFRIVVISNETLTHHLNYVYLKQNFEVGTGEFSFVTDENNKEINEIFLFLPLRVDPNSVRCFNQSGKEYRASSNNLKELDCQVTQRDKKSVIIQFEKNLSDDERILITYPLQIIPNNIFIIDTEGTLWYDGGLHGNIIFYIGDSYECVADCFYDLRHIQIYSRYDKTKERHLTFENFEQETYHNFKMLTKSRKILNSKNAKLSSGIALVTGSIFSLFCVLIFALQSFFTYLKDKDKKR